MSNYSSGITPASSAVPLNWKISPPPATSLSVGAYAAIAAAACVILSAAVINIRWVLRRFNVIAAARNEAPEPAWLRSKSIAALPAFACPQPAGDHGEAAECCICLGPLSKGEMARAMPGCEHVFHVVCIDQWLRCRATCHVCCSDVRLHIPANLAGRGEEKGSATSATSTAASADMVLLDLDSWRR